MDFKDWLTEVSHEDLSKIGQAVNSSLSHNRTPGKPTSLPFDNLFGHNLRIVIPLDDTQERQVRHSLEAQGYKVDFQRGLVHSTIQTQKGPKERTERLGAVLKKLGSRPGGENWLKTLKWWEKNQPSLARPKKGGVSVVISRSPIDILRMSDHSEWSSCHSPGQSWWKCAMQEAKTGGAIAYVVRNSDLEEVPDLQAKDLFRDSDRNVDGIEPLERVRLRRFSRQNGLVDRQQLLMPEVRTYGTKHVGFLDAVTDWARHAQRDVVDLSNPPNPDEWSIHGGSYQDNNAGSLWNNFFQTLGGTTG